jgi:hypothetical protein
MNFKITHISTATMLLEIGSLRILTDPVFDSAGGRYYFGWGTGSTKLTSPPITPDTIGQVDAVLLSHDHHEDNLDKTGREFLPKAKRVLTTTSGEKRLRGNAEGLKDWQSGFGIRRFENQSDCHARTTRTTIRPSVCGANDRFHAGMGRTTERGLYISATRSLSASK